jgi:hypothetical protein
MEDYQSNAKKRKLELGAGKPEIKVEKVVSSEVIVQKKPLGRKFKEMLIEADFRSVGRYIVSDLIFPAIKDTIVNVTTKGVERAVYGESAIRRRNVMMGGRTSYTSYSSGVNREYPRDPRLAPSSRHTMPRASRPARDDYIISSREEADLILEKMNDVIEQYDFVSVAVFNELMGLPSSYVDEKWGWVYLGDARIREIREGYLIDLPPADTI